MGAMFCAIIGRRLRDIIVGVTNTHPSSRNPLFSSFTACYNHRGGVHEGHHLKVWCYQPIFGRYVFIAMPGKREFLQLSEVDVFVK